ncbi:MAG TPA: response regulator transcription factor [Actinomycetales bacterium]|nr:response regulator transcription factor [Actinomycetales bacterium]
MTTVVVVDDQDVVRAGLIRILESEPGLVVVGQAADGEAGVREVRRTRPDVCLMDIRMPVLDGLAATRRVLAEHNDVRVVILTTFDLDEYVYEALRLGASGFVLKDAPAEEIVRAVDVASRGDATVDPSVTRRLITEFARRRPRRRLPGTDLTAREEEVLIAMAHGLSNLEIGARLFISEGTVRTHVNRLLTKLGVRDRLQAVVLAYECGLVEPGHTEQV